MGFFQKIRNKIEDGVKDMTSLQNGLIVQHPGPDKDIIVYSKKDSDADVINVIQGMNSESDLKFIEIHNQICEVSQLARLGLTTFIIETLTKRK